VWEWRPESSSCSPGFLNRACYFRIPLWCSFVLVFPIFILEFDLNFQEFGLISGVDFLDEVMLG
jgi:hypothetical protein